MDDGKNPQACLLHFKPPQTKLFASLAPPPIFSFCSCCHLQVYFDPFPGIAAFCQSGYLCVDIHPAVHHTGYYCIVRHRDISELPYLHVHCHSVFIVWVVAFAFEAKILTDLQSVPQFFPAVILETGQRGFQKEYLLCLPGF